MEKCKPFCKEMHHIEGSQRLKDGKISGDYRCAICRFIKTITFKYGK